MRAKLTIILGLDLVFGTYKYVIVTLCEYSN